MPIWKNLAGTLETAFRIGKAKATIDASALTAARTFTLPDAAGTLALSNIDQRKLSPFLVKVRSGATVKVAQVGDSTVEQMESIGMFTHNAVSATMGDWFPSLSKVIWLMYGKTGAILKDFYANVAVGTNIVGTDCRLSAVAASGADLFYITYGLNDTRGTYPPGTAGNPLGGNFPDWRVAYGAAGMVNMALALQEMLRQAVVTIRASNPTACFILRMPNALRSNTSFLLNSVTAQQCQNVCRLTYRGDAALSVPSLETLLGANVLVQDVQATVYCDTVYPTQTELITEASDGFHPSSPIGYSQIMWHGGYLMQGPYSNEVTSSADGYRLAMLEQSIAHGWYAPIHKPDVLRYSGEYDLVTPAVTGVTGANFQIVKFSPNAVVSAMWGANTGETTGARKPPMLSRGDFYSFNNGGAELVGVVGPIEGSNPTGAYLQIAPLDIGGNTIAGGSAIPQDLSGYFYRHKYANSIAGRRQVFEQARSVYQAQQGFQQILRCAVTAASNGSITLRSIRLGLAERTLQDHVFRTDDLLCLEGVEGQAAGQFGLWGIGLGSATFTRSATAMGLEVTIALSGTDFSTFSGGQALLLSKTAAAADVLDYTAKQNFRPAGSTTVGTPEGIVLTSVGTVSHPTGAVTDRRQATRRTLWTSSATAGSGAGIYETVATRLQGSVNRIGGYKLDITFGQEHNVGSTRSFVGLTNSVAALSGDPSALTNIVGVGYDVADTTNWRLMVNDGSGTATKFALDGSTFQNGLVAMPRDATSIYRMIIECRAGVAGIAVSLYNLTTKATILDRAVYTSDIPANNSLLALRANAHNAAVASAVSVFVSSMDAGITELS